MSKKRELLVNNLPVLLYGIGKYGKRVFEILRNRSIEVSAVCLDKEFYNPEEKLWNGLPVYLLEEVYERFGQFIIVIGFYEIMRAKDLKIDGCKEIYFWNDAGQFVSNSELPSLEKEMLDFFKGDTNALNIKSAVHLFLECKRTQVEFLNYNLQTDIMSLQTTDGLTLITNSYNVIFIEIFCKEIYRGYQKFINNKEYILFDIGANRGYTSLYFSNDSNCKHIFSFEPDSETLAYFYTNLKLNPDVSDKISILEYGLFDKNETLSFFKTLDGTDGVNTFDKNLIGNVWDSHRKRNLREIKLQVYKASEAITKLNTEHNISPDLKKVMKIDAEGAEYAILLELKESGLLNDFNVIFGECHSGIEGVMAICEDKFELKQCVKEAGDADGLFNFILLNKKNFA
jgi:FkbM family methyltransferase